MGTPHNSWLHRFALLTAIATLGLIAIGGLVTSKGVGMAVPDWPNTYGYNLFLYPWQTWLAGPWDLFVEHGHRMLAATVGLIFAGTGMSLFLLWMLRQQGRTLTLLRAS